MNTSPLSYLTGSTVELLVSCSDLADLDEFTKSDPMCVMFVKQFGQWQEYGRTEARRNTLSPKFTQSFLLEFDADHPQSLLFRVYDIDNKDLNAKGNKKKKKSRKKAKSTARLANPLLTMFPGDSYALDDRPLLPPIGIDSGDTWCSSPRKYSGGYLPEIESTDLRHHDLVGSYEASISELLHQGSNMYTTCKTLRVAGNSRARGIISITSEVLRPCKDRLSLHVGAQRLDKTGKIITTKPDVYLEISRSLDNVSFHPVFRTEIVQRSQKPRWRPFELGLQKLCNGDWDRLLEFSCWHHTGSGDYKMIGRKTTSLRELNLLKPNGHYKELVLVPRKKDNHRSSVKITTRGCITFFKFRIDHQFSFLDYVRGGLQLRPMLGIDFTSSNGQPNEQLCLHDISLETGNQYIDVIESLAAMVTQYSADQSVSLFGFGAKLMGSGETSHCFPLSGDWGRVGVQGIETVIHNYKETVRRVRFSGPTRVKPLIAMAESMAVNEPTQDKQFYHVLIVMTDGVINDIDDVIERLVSISHLPLSVVFVGVGPADFTIMTLMRQLLQELSHLGLHYLQDIFNHHNVHHLSLGDKKDSSIRKHTHFVACHQDKRHSVGMDFMAKEAFAVVCTQVVDYMKSKTIMPNRPILGTNSSIDLLVDLEDEAKDTVSLKSISTINVQSQKVEDKSGPRCPTCGSALEPGTFMYSEMNSIA